MAAARGLGTRSACLATTVVLLACLAYATATNVTCTADPSVVLCAWGPPGEKFGDRAHSKLFVDGQERPVGVSLVQEQPRGMLMQVLKPDMDVCTPGLILPLFLAEESWSTGLRAFLYLIALLWSFMGIAIIADMFMASIEVITSTTKTVTYTNPATNRVRTLTVQVWNETIANLTLMALGSSAPEILLAVIETVGQLGKPPSDGLGPSTIVGSAAFNLLMILAVCVVSVPKGQTRRVKERSVFIITALSSVLAYVWLLVVLQWNTEGVVDLPEALITLAMFPFLVCMSYAADRNWFRKQTDNVKEASESGTGQWVTGTGGMGARRYGSNPDLSEVVVPLQTARDSVGNGTRGSGDGGRGHVLHAPPRQTRATYRMHGVRMMTGGAPVIVSHEKLASIEAEVRLQAHEQLAKGVADQLARASSRANLTAGLLADNVTQVTFSAPQYGVLERDGRVVLPVVRTGCLDRPVSVSFETSNGTALAGEDYVSTSGILSFAEHQREATIAIPITDDDKMEPDENFFCTLRPVPNRLVDPTAPTVAFGDYPVAEIIIIDDDRAGTFSFEKAVYSVPENCGHVELAIVRKNGSDGVVTIEHSTSDGNAVAGRDYKPANGTITFGNGELRKVVRVPIIDDEAYEKEEFFKVSFKFKGPDTGAEYGERKTATVNITNDEEYKRTVDKLAMIINLNLDRLQIRTTTWGKQYRDAMTVFGSDVEAGPTTFDYVMHFVSFFWKVLFAAVPPTSIGGGWVAFSVALIFIGLLTMVVGDLASIFGCMLGLPDAITAITFVALGTSLPDTFASKAAAVNDRHADASVGNVTGSNSVNVFLGLGLPWSIAAIYHQINGTKYEVSGGTLSFSVLVFCVCAVLCIGVLFLRRNPSVAGGELGGPQRGKWATFAFFAFLWLTYIVLSSLKSLGKI